jgi:hypothetical protein
MTVICPGCGRENDEGAARCAACGDSLTEAQGGGRTDIDDRGSPWDAVEWVTVEETSDEGLTEQVEGHLLEHGFPVRVLHRRTVEQPASAERRSIIEIQVIDDDLDRALGVLASLDDLLDASAD